MQFYNTLGHEIQNFKSIKKDNVGFYTCGPTVYWFAHIGNMRTYVQEDLLKRALMHEGYHVKHVMNITDVGHLVGDASIGEDKIKLEARREHKSAYDVAKFYEDAFLKDLKRLNIIMPDIIPKATEHINEMLDLIKKLDEKNYLYKISTGIYYDTSKFKRYGELIGMNFDQLNKQLKAGARVERASGLKNITDFAVWRFAKGDEKEMVWDSAWGKGFPGWHIECSTMSMKYLGEHFDIHCGGIDHIPIHHTNEIAQSEAATGKKFVNYWFHVAFLTVNNMKMSKSLKNIHTVQDIIDRKYSPLALRYFLISSHYRNQQNFTFEALENASKTLESIYGFIRKINAIKIDRSADADAIKQLEIYHKEFFERVGDDLDMPNALKSMHALIDYENKRLAENKVAREEAKKVIEIVLDFDMILGLELNKEIEEKKLPEEVAKLIDERESARKEKNFEKADKIRKEIEERYDIIIEDTKEGVSWHYK
ncbi:MAG: cysteine--tRNA ligase [Candidatus Micrarchaeia archaeon]